MGRRELQPGARRSPGLLGTQKQEASLASLSFHLVGSLKLLAGWETVTQVLGGVLSPPLLHSAGPCLASLPWSPTSTCAAPRPVQGALTAVSQLAGRQCRAGPAGIACPTRWLPAHKPVTALSSASQGAGTPRPAESAEHPLHLSSCSGAQVHSPGPPPSQGAVPGLGGQGCHAPSEDEAASLGTGSPRTAAGR